MFFTAEMTTDISSPRFFSRMDVSDFRFMFFVAAVVVYGIGSSPTPDTIGGAEIFTGLFLILAAGSWKVARVFWKPAPAAWGNAAQVFLFYGLTVPIVAGVAGGHDTGGMIRDLIAFLFLLLPLFMHDLCAHKENYRRPLTAAIVITGLLFSLRVLAPVFQKETGPVWYIQPPADPFYLANAPTVLFAALLLGGLAGKQIFMRINLKNISGAALFSVLAFFPLAAMALITQRASMGVIALSTLLLMAVAFWRAPRRAVVPLIALLLAAWVGWDAISFIGYEAARKTAAVGINMRWAEAMAVINDLAASPLAVIFGKGWGASVASPAVGGVTVNFTHSLLTTYWLKTGLLGLSLALFYLFHIAQLLWRMLFNNPIMALALAGPLAIDTLLYASFKSLDFGLVLLLVPLWAAAAVPVASKARSL